MEGGWEERRKERKKGRKRKRGREERRKLWLLFGTFSLYEDKFLNVSEFYFDVSSKISAFHKHMDIWQVNAVTYVHMKLLRLTLAFLLDVLIVELSTVVGCFKQRH